MSKRLSKPRRPVLEAIDAYQKQSPEETIVANKTKGRQKKEALQRPLTWIPPRKRYGLLTAEQLEAWKDQRVLIKSGCEYFRDCGKGMTPNKHDAHWFRLEELGLLYYPKSLANDWVIFMTPTRKPRPPAPASGQPQVSLPYTIGNIRKRQLAFRRATLKDEKLILHKIHALQQLRPGPPIFGREHALQRLERVQSLLCAIREKLRELDQELLHGLLDAETILDPNFKKVYERLRLQPTTFE